jgi:hypothetical protein
VTNVIKDITEDFAYDLAVSAEATNNYQLSDISFDIAVNNMPFFIAATDEQPYRRESAPSKREQIDQTTEPGEQSFTGWWFRSQSSFHLGAGAKFFEPAQDETLRFRYQDSQGVDVWTKGQASLLKDTVKVLTTTNNALIIGANDGTNDCLVVADGSDLKKITLSTDTPTVTTYTLVANHTTQVFQSLTTDGTRYFAADTTAIHVGNIGGTTSDDTTYATGTTRVVINFVKQRLFAGVTNKLYELNPNATPAGSHATIALPTAHYTHPNSAWSWTAITESGPAIYAAGYAGKSSAIYKVTLKDDATLNAATVTAELPVGETVQSLFSYLGYIIIGTSKGVRVAQVEPNTGDLAYGPLIFETTDGVKSIFAKDRFVWCAGKPNSITGLIRIDLSEQISPLRFAYAPDLQATGTSVVNSVTQIGDRVAFGTVDNGVWVERATQLVASGFIRTGFIRYATIESKFFKFLKVRGNLDDGTIDVNTITNKEVDTFLYNVTTETSNLDLGIARPVGAQEYLAFKFDLNRDDTDTAAGAVMSGYQVKSLPAIEKQRLIQFPLYCYDVEMDKYNNIVGSEDDRAFDRISELESIERTGNIVTIQDFRTDETYSALIEEIRFFSATPPSERFNGFGGKLLLTVRKLS